jgi:hypothetical protein
MKEVMMNWTSSKDEINKKAHIIKCKYNFGRDMPQEAINWNKWTRLF